MSKFTICTKIQVYCPRIKDKSNWFSQMSFSYVDEFVQFSDLLIYNTIYMVALWLTQAYRQWIKCVRRALTIGMNLLRRILRPKF